ncbi:MAG: hypothetical protein ACLQGP_36900 [Isosphaeraceae bacterium]
MFEPSWPVEAVEPVEVPVWAVEPEPAEVEDPLLAVVVEAEPEPDESPVEAPVCEPDVLVEG